MIEMYAVRGVDRWDCAALFGPGAPLAAYRGTALSFPRDAEPYGLLVLGPVAASVLHNLPEGGPIELADDALIVNGHVMPVRVVAL